jgi:hypothetical protein
MMHSKICKSTTDEIRDENCLLLPTSFPLLALTSTCLIFSCFSSTLANLCAILGRRMYHLVLIRFLCMLL